MANPSWPTHLMAIASEMRARRLAHADSQSSEATDKHQLFMAPARLLYANAGIWALEWVLVIPGMPMTLSRPAPAEQHGWSQLVAAEKPGASSGRTASATIDRVGRHAGSHFHAKCGAKCGNGVEATADWEGRFF
jgi:hypothetical protein